MNPSLSNISEENDVLRFTISGLDVSLANALRRLILNDIPTIVIRTENAEVDQCKITVNTGRLHNEIIKQRLSCIPIHMKDLEQFPQLYQLELEEQNTTENIRMITTEDFKIRNKTNGNYLTKDETRKIFPPDPLTNSFIDFVRLRPRIGDGIPGEQIKLTADFSVSTAKENGMFNVVSKCAYANTLDIVAADDQWANIEKKLSSDGLTAEDIKFQKKNFKVLDAQRFFVKNSYDFVVQTIGVYTNTEIVKLACDVFIKKMNDMITAVESDIVPIHNSPTTVDHSYDIILEDEDYTVGKVLEYILYEKYYMGEQIFSFCGFKKMHPHDHHSIIRIAYKMPTDKNLLRSHLRTAILESVEVFKKLRVKF